MRVHLLLALGVAMSTAACTTADTTSEDVQSVGVPTWVNLGTAFGPCPVLPATCQVGQTTSAHSGPGNDGGCYNYKCELLGTWVNHGSAFGPCLVLPATCQVGDTITAHSGPGTAGGCYYYQCE